MNQNTANVTFLYMPIDGVAAYWLSLRKLLGGARNLKALESEAQFVDEPFVRYLLEMLMSQLSPQRGRLFAELALESELVRLNRQLNLIRVAVMDITTGENPLRSLARLSAQFPSPPEDAERLMEAAQANAGQAVNSILPPESYRIDHFMTDDALTGALLFYIVLSRRHGKNACRSFLPQKGSLFFTDALSLVVDGFDAPFVRKWMKQFKETILTDMRRKMMLSIDMCSAIGERLSFEDMRFLVRSYIR